MSKSEAQVLDFEKICRLCLLEKRSMSSIFTKKKSDKKVPLPVRIMSCASLELYEGDGLPASICSKCLLSVNQSYAFREQCEQADTTLRQYAQRMNEPSGETSSNRESRERIAIDSLEHVQEMKIKIEERNDHEDQDFERSDNLDLNSGKFAKSSTGNLREIGNEQFNFRTKETFLECHVTEKFFKKENRGSAGEVVTAIFGKASHDEHEFKSSLIGKDSAINGKTKFSEDTKSKDDNINRSFQKRDSHSPLLKALSEEKAEDVVIMADIPVVLEDEDFDFDETGSEDDDSIKSKTHKWVRHGFRSKRQLLSQALGEEKFYKKNPPKQNSFENKKHLELLQNLMKNKSIIIQKRAACVSADILSGKIFTLKNQEFNKILRCKKGLTFPYDFKIAQLWKEWEEVNKRIPKVLQKNLESKKMCSALPDVNKDDSSKTVSSCKELSNDCSVYKRSKDSSELSLVEHFRDHENGGNPKAKWKNAKETVYCKECRIFLLRSSYSNHIKFVHKKIRKYLCQTCGYAACTGTILRQHVQAVHIGYSFFCDQCPKKFNLIKRLRKHIELHHSGKPIERNQICQFCGMAFVKPGCLKRHLRSHTQETPYECQYCQRRFKYRWPKVQHERLHTGEKPYKCSFCEESFIQNCVRKAHEYKKHGNEEFKPKTRIAEESATTQKIRSEKEDSDFALEFS